MMPAWVVIVCNFIFAVCTLYAVCKLTDGAKSRINEEFQQINQNFNIMSCHLNVLNKNTETLKARIDRLEVRS